MAEPIVSVERHFSTITSIVVKVEWYQPPRIANPTPEELALVPERFRCQVCLRVKTKRHFGGFINEARVCQECYPYVTSIPTEPRHTVATRWIRPLVCDVWEGIKPEMVAQD